MPLHHLPPRRQLALKAPAGVGRAGAGELVDGHAQGAGVAGVFEALAAVVRNQPQLRAQRDFLRISFGKYFFKDLALARRWGPSQVTPFERVRVQDPQANTALNDEALRNLKGISNR